MLNALRSKDTLSGLLFATLGLVGAVLSLGLPIGDRIRMDAGYMPFALSVALTGLGVLILARSLLNTVATAAAAWQLRPLLFVVGAALVFGLTIERTGLLLSIFLTV